MWPLIEASIVTSTAYVGLMIAKRNVKPIVFVMIFISAWLGGVLFGTHLHAQLLDSKFEINQIRFYLSHLETKLSREDKKFYQNKIQFHSENGDRCYKDAKNKCAFLPRFDDRKNAQFCLVTATTLIAPADPVSKLVCMTLELFVYYGLNVMDEWEYIENKLNWAAYHYDLMEFYQQVVIQEA